MRPILGPVLAIALILPASRALALDAGTILENFAYGEFQLASGEPGGEVVGGINILNVPNSQSAWVLITDEPQLCLKLWKQADDGDWTKQTTVVPGGKVCFTISYSNCGNISVSGITLIDLVPANVVRDDTPAGYDLYPGIFWATGISGPWSTFDMVGQEGPFYIMHTISRLGIGQTGYVSYCVDVL